MPVKPAATEGAAPGKIESSSGTEIETEEE